MEDFNLFGVLAIILGFIFIVVTFNLLKALKKIFTAVRSKN